MNINQLIIKITELYDEIIFFDHFQKPHTITTQVTDWWYW